MYTRLSYKSRLNLFSNILFYDIPIYLKVLSGYTLYVMILESIKACESIIVTVLFLAINIVSIL